MIKKRYIGKIHRQNLDEDNHLWFFYGLNSKVKKIKPQKQSKKSKIFSLLFFLLNIVVVGIILAVQINSEEGITPIKNLFNSNNNGFFLFLAIMCFVVSEAFIGLRIYALTRKFNKKGNYFTSLKSEFVCQYYSKITPFSIGGQPFQVYELNKKGVKASNAITVVSCNYVCHKLVYWIVSLFMMLTIWSNSLVKSMSGASFNIVLILAGISLATMTAFLTFVIFICVNKKVASKLVSMVINLLFKLKIVKNRKSLYFKIMRPALSFQFKMKKFFTSKKFAICALILSIAVYLIQASIPACIYFIFKPFSLIDFWRLLSISVVIQLSFGVNPIPGGSGVAELSFYAVFAYLIDNSLLFWALIIWRILTYYIFLVIGLGTVVYDYSYGNRKRKNLKQNINKKIKNNE